ncbi:MAG TPA: tetrahydrofolate dehydrogenase/cyclohydrolase catalytic domain-containing protein, partial [Candidatus Nitrosocosmicus sp.]|nr:tetrahydrofolate dehydrogenase/cyclohydrolase catalytic domain-containing protein [Candidatus Nitrosocosmicus sp.]
MTAKIIDGLTVSKHVKENLKTEIEELRKLGKIPCLATILTGDDPPSIIYVNNKQKAANSIGIKTLDYRLDKTASENEIIHIIENLNTDKSVHGILLQLPLPDHLDSYKIINKIKPGKDVDGLTFVNA